MKYSRDISPRSSAHYENFHEENFLLALRSILSDLLKVRSASSHLIFYLTSFIQLDQLSCIGEESYVEPFFFKFNELRRREIVPFEFLPDVSNTLLELIETKKSVDDLRMKMIAHHFLPKVHNWDSSKKAPSIHDFQILKPISKGAYGRVFLAQKITTKDVYAIKVLNRQEMRTNRQRENVLLEVEMLSSKLIRKFICNTERHFGQDIQPICCEIILCISDAAPFLFGNGIPPWW
jgi:hypothetical protein